MLGREYMGVARCTLIIDPDGKVARTFPKVRSAGEHPAEVEAALTELRRGRT
jgi:peroxiredoxin Q/BCP